MKSANPYLLAAQLPLAANVHLSSHAVQRAAERTLIDPGKVRQLIAERIAVVLPYRAHGNETLRTYHLLFDVEVNAFCIAVVALDSSHDSAHVVTVLTREQFENDGGHLSPKQLRTAASRVLDPVAFRRWESEEFAERPVRRRYRVITYYRSNGQDGAGGTGDLAHVVFKNPPLCDTFVDEHSLSNASAHPGFWEWFAREAKEAGLPIDRVVSMRIADTDKVQLNISAAARQCPCCAGRHAGQVH